MKIPSLYISIETVNDMFYYYCSEISEAIVETSMDLDLLKNSRNIRTFRKC